MAMSIISRPANSPVAALQEGTLVTLQLPNTEVGTKDRLPF